MRVAFCLFLATACLRVASATKPMPMSSGEETKYFAQQERELVYREGLDEGVALYRLRRLALLSAESTRSRALRDRLLFAYPEAVVATFGAELPGDTRADVVLMLSQRLNETPEFYAKARQGFQRWLETYRHTGSSDAYLSVAALHFDHCGRESSLEEARKVLCSRRVMDEKTLEGVAGRRRIVPTDAEWAKLPHSCREKLSTEVSCDFPVEATDGLHAFACRTDADCVAVKNGCGVRAIIDPRGDSPNVHSRHRCECIQGQVVRGCFPERGRRPFPERSTTPFGEFQR